MRITGLVCLWGLGLSVSAAGQPYEPNWASLDQRPTPAWFKEAKFGIFIHWGVYSVPAWGPKGRYAEWYWNDMQDKSGETWKFHAATYGEDFPYQHFAHRFTADMFDPAHWADIFARSGARYIVLTSKHHEGYCLWPSAESWNWNSVDVGSGRDLCGELTQAVRAKGLKMGFYYSLYEWFNPIYRTDVARFVDQHTLPQIKDLVTRFEPDIVWTDGEWDHPSSTWRSEEFLAWLFSESSVKDFVAVNDRWGKETRGVHGGYYTTEYGHGGEAAGKGHPWEECRGIGASFGYNRNETVDDYATGPALIRLLIDTASRGGNLLLDIGPTADGRIPVIMEQRLLEIGQWLEVNGESIYGTEAGPFQDLPWGKSTLKGNRVYLHVYEWPQDGALNVPGLRQPIARAFLLAQPDQPLQVETTADVLRVALPPTAPDTAATVIVLEGE